MSAAYRDHLGPWAGLGSSSNYSNHNNGDADDHDEAPMLLQKARYFFFHPILAYSSSICIYLRHATDLSDSCVMMFIGFRSSWCSSAWVGRCAAPLARTLRANRSGGPLPAPSRVSLQAASIIHHPSIPSRLSCVALVCACRLRVKGLGATTAEREQALLRCLPKLGPKGEQQRLPRLDLTRLLQQLRVGVR